MPQKIKSKDHNKDKSIISNKKINEVEEESSDEELFMPEKPSYFNCDEIELDSEEEQAIGENNYIEIEAMPLDRRNRPPNEAPE